MANSVDTEINNNNKKKQLRAVAGQCSSPESTFVSKTLTKNFNKDTRGLGWYSIKLQKYIPLPSRDSGDIAF